MALKKQLYNMIYDDVGYGQRSFNDVVHQGVRHPQELPAAVAPGTVIALNRLDPDHPACNYIRSRGYDPVDLYSRYRVCYCAEARKEYPLVTGRIVIPIYFREKLVGWQARLINQPSNKYVPKYYTAPGLAKGSLLYNFDAARRHPYVVVTEGVFDAWRYGPEAVALLGNKLTGAQALLLHNTWAGKAVVCLLDGAARDENQELYDMLKGTPVRPIRVDLPEDRDPDTCARSFLRSAVAQAALAQGVNLTLLQKSPV